MPLFFKCSRELWHHVSTQGGAAFCGQLWDPSTAPPRAFKESTCWPEGQQCPDCLRLSPLRPLTQEDSKRVRHWVQEHSAKGDGLWHYVNGPQGADSWTENCLCGQRPPTGLPVVAHQPPPDARICTVCENILAGMGKPVDADPAPRMDNVVYRANRLAPPTTEIKFTAQYDPDVFEQLMEAGLEEGQIVHACTGPVEGDHVTVNGKYTRQMLQEIIDKFPKEPEPLPDDLQKLVEDALTPGHITAAHPDTIAHMKAHGLTDDMLKLTPCSHLEYGQLVVVAPMELLAPLPPVRNPCAES